jgi:5-methylcytosine-specific restriction endonuclease McrA
MRKTKFDIELKKEICKFAKQSSVYRASCKFKINNQTIYNWMKKYDEILTMDNIKLDTIRENKLRATTERERSKRKTRYYKSGQRWQRNNSERKNHQKRIRRRSYYRTREQELQKIRNKKHIFRTRANVTNHIYKHLGVITAKDLWSIAKLQRLLCPLTGLKLNSDNMSVDHIIPISKGGLNIKLNIRLVHKWANKMRLNYSDDELINMCKIIYLHSLKDC